MCLYSYFANLLRPLAKVTTFLILFCVLLFIVVRYNRHIIHIINSCGPVKGYHHIFRLNIVNVTQLYQ